MRTKLTPPLIQNGFCEVIFQSRNSLPGREICKVLYAANSIRLTFCARKSLNRGVIVEGRAMRPGKFVDNRRWVDEQEAVGHGGAADTEKTLGSSGYVIPTVTGMARLAHSRSEPQNIEQ